MGPGFHPHSMTPSIARLLVAAILITPAALAQDAKPNLEDPRLRASYAIGADIGGNLKRQEIDVDPTAIARGLSDSLSGKALLTDAEVQAALAEFRSQMMARMEARQKTAATDNLKKGEAFLAANASKSGVKTTASGLQYKVLKAGTGKSPKASDTVRVHYHGTLIDGTVFDSSVDRGEPIEFPVTGVIPGWVEALQLMKEGDKWQLFIPAALAYGERSPGGAIGPNSTLLFDVELLAVQPAN